MVIRSSNTMKDSVPSEVQNTDNSTTVVRPISPMSQWVGWFVVAWRNVRSGLGNVLFHSSGWLKSVCASYS